MLNVLIADDHDTVRRGLKEILREVYKEVDFGEAASATDVLTRIRSRQWDLVLLDIQMPGPSVVEVLAQIRSNSSVPILILTASPEHSYATKTIKAGANGYINKHYASEQLINAIKCVLKGETYLSQEAVQVLASSLRVGGGAEQPHEKLSARELEILRMISSGKSVKIIAADLHLSEKTIASYLSRIKEKTRLSSYVEMTRYAIQHRLIE
jgi:DNA-binding NarL/FixJ family response regulator